MMVEIEADVPKGWKAVAYRRPKKGEYIFDENGVQEYYAGTHGCYLLIVEKEKPVRRVFEFTGEVRCPEVGEYVNNGVTGIEINVGQYTNMRREIWREVTEEIENE